MFLNAVFYNMLILVHNFNPQGKVKRNIRRGEMFDIFSRYPFLFLSTLPEILIRSNNQILITVYTVFNTIIRLNILNIRDTSFVEEGKCKSPTQCLIDIFFRGQIRLYY